MGGKLSGKMVAIVVTHRFEDIELLYPLLRLSEEGAEVAIVAVGGTSVKPVTGMIGHQVPIQVMAEGKRYVVRSLGDLSADGIDCLLFPGGYSPDQLRLDPDTLELTRACHRKGKIIAALSHS